MTLSEQLEQLDDLHRRGVLTDDEFARAKASTLASPAPAPSHPGLAAINGLRRSRHDRWLGGVCGGLADSFGLAAWAWRLGFLLLLLCAGSGLLVYALMWFFVPLGSDTGRFGGDAGPLHAH